QSEFSIQPGSNGADIAFNTYYNGSNDKYLTSNSGFVIFHNPGTENLEFKYAPTGTAGNTATYSNAMAIGQNGQIAFGEANFFTPRSLPSAVTAPTGYVGWDYTVGQAASRRWWLGNDQAVYGDFAIRTESAQGSASPNTTRLYIDPAGNIG